MHIALCDDEENALLLLREMVQAFCEKKRLEAVIDLFSGGEDFLASAQRYDILFMDIYLPGMNGMEAAERAGALARQQIVFTTVSREYAVEAFRLNAAHYLTKPLSAQSVAEAMERCLMRLGGATPEKPGDKDESGNDSGADGADRVYRSAEQAVYCTYRQKRLPHLYLSGRAV